ncbi:MAG: tRNA (guanosine(37)-N1)-methyltransferase TrmD [Bacteroidetes bacterium]|nr:tRNA (guanosine(37)-N1)-methyltransferase TrmD [Bacteroidota bacterium]
MQIDILTCLPEIFNSFLNTSIIKRARDKKEVNIIIHNIRDFAQDKHKKVDDYPYGGNSGMVLKIEPIVNCLDYLKSIREYDEIIYMSPDGELLNQKKINSLTLTKNLIIICGHYKGIDERIRENFVTMEISIGEYVLTGGELASAVLVDCITRLLPGSISDSTSALNDSFQDDLIAPPEYTRPYDFRGLKVPDILLSGNEKAIAQWRDIQSIKRTKKNKNIYLNKNK